MISVPETAPHANSVAFEASKHYAIDPSPKEVMSHLQNGRVVVLRQNPEILHLGKKLLEVAEKLDGPSAALLVQSLMKSGSVENLEALAIFYRAFRVVLDSRYVSCLFSDLIESFHLPKPLLIDSGYCRMVVPRHYGEAKSRPDLFDRTEFQARGPTDREVMFYSDVWGNPHRDIDARHGHFQFNIWFPMHDLEAEQSLLFFLKFTVSMFRSMRLIWIRTDPRFGDSVQR